MQVLRPATLLKRYSNTGIYLWNFRNFLEHLFRRISANDYFCSFIFMAPVLESLHNKFASLQICNFIKKRLQHRCFLVKFAKFLRTPFVKSTSGGCFWIFKQKNNVFCIALKKVNMSCDTMFINFSACTKKPWVGKSNSIKRLCV